MKKIVILFVVAVLAAVFFSTVRAEPRLTGSLDFGYYSKEISSIGGATVFNHQVFQQSLTITDAKTGLHGTLWSSYSPKGGFNSDFGDEVDYVAGIYRSFFDGKFALDFGYAYLNLYNLNNTRGDLHDVYLYLYPPSFLSLKPYLLLEKDFPTNKNVVPGNFLYRAGLKYDLAIPEFLSTKAVNLDLSFGGHDEDFTGRAELISYARLNIAATFKAAAWLSITPLVNFQKRLGYARDNGGATEDKIWYGINFSIPIF